MRMTNQPAFRWWLGVVAILAVVGCERVKQTESSMAVETHISAAEWQALSQRRVVFAHQSVGQNILDGVQSLAVQAGVQLPIVNTRLAAKDAGIVHFFVGRNEDPASKLRDFADVLEGGAAAGADIALLKLCYIDFKEETDARKLAEKYIATLDGLGQRFPSTSFVAVTAPLTVVQTGPKAWVKRLLGREPAGYRDNARRHEFNHLLRERYERRGLLFDLAKIEAEGAGGNQYQGRPLEALNPALTIDGGHLTAQGGQVVAARLVKYLAALPEPD